MLLNHHFQGRCICVVATVCGDTSPSACILMFLFRLDVSGWGGGAFPSANDSMQVRLRAQQSTATGCPSDQRN